MPYANAWYPPPSLRITPDESFALLCLLNDSTQRLATWIKRAEIGVRYMEEIDLGRKHLECLQSLRTRLMEMEVPSDWLDKGSFYKEDAGRTGVFKDPGEELP